MTAMSRATWANGSSTVRRYRSTSGWADARPSAAPAVGPGVAFMTVPLGHIADEADARLFIVESRAAGELQTTIVGRGIPVFQPVTDAEAGAR